MHALTKECSIEISAMGITATDEQRKEIEEFFKELDGFSMDRTKTKKKSAPKKKKEAIEEANSDS